jgi:phosphopantetheine adenylyltransferase
MKNVGEYADATLIRGLLNAYDLQYESNLNQFMTEVGDVDVAYFLSDLKYRHISSTQIRELNGIDEDLARRYEPTKYQY